MRQKIENKSFVFEINSSELLALNCLTKKRMLVIGSQCVKKKSSDFSCD